MMTTNSVGLYIHIPFCVKKCNYCDFSSFSNLTAEVKRDYIDRLIFELEGYRAEEKISVDTIFFGGGTPSLLEPDELFKICGKIREIFDVSADLEFTIEVNPKTLTLEKAHAFMECGINRVSIGLQTIHENELKILGRVHSFEDFVECYNMLSEVGISNISVDLMYGIPEQTIDTFKKTLKAVCDMNPCHISTYGLILEEGTPFWNMRENLALPSEDQECDMYYAACSILFNHGYKHYEISNFAKSGFESKHNLKYWQHKEYIGVGLSAYSNINCRRYGNTNNLQDYISNKSTSISYSENIDKDDAAYEYAMLHLRLKDGFSLSEYKNLFGVDFLVGREALIDKYSRAGCINISDGMISLTERGFYISNTILSDLL